MTPDKDKPERKPAPKKSTATASAKGATAKPPGNKTAKRAPKDPTKGLVDALVGGVIGDPHALLGRHPAGKGKTIVTMT